jgi:hypothetical protein
MKAFSIILSALMLSLPFASPAQQSSGEHDSIHDCCKKVNIAQKPAVTKGYYAIGNNAKKLNSGNAAYSACGHSPAIAVNNTRPKKGYYAIGNNSQQLPNNVNRIETGEVQIRASKGYYSIGNNATKAGKTTCPCCDQ